MSHGDFKNTKIISIQSIKKSVYFGKNLIIIPIKTYFPVTENMEILIKFNF